MLKKICLSLLLGLLLAGKTFAQGVDYYLPYPGLLPDHPLYWLKMVRDRTQLVFTTNQEAKAERLLLYADKRLGAAWALIDGNKTALGVSTLTKAEKYLEQAWNQGRGTPLEEKLSKAVKKHLEVTRGLKDKSGSYVALVDEMIAKIEAVNDQTKSITIPVSVSVEVVFDEKNSAAAKVEAQTALEALEKAATAAGWEVQKKNYDFGTMVLGIGGTPNTRFMSWIYYVNGQPADRSADKFELKAGDKVEWRYEKVKP